VIHAPGGQAFSLEVPVLFSFAVPEAAALNRFVPGWPKPRKCGPIQNGKKLLPFPGRERRYLVRYQFTGGTIPHRLKAEQILLM
jgi:hypothetical protein